MQLSYIENLTDSKLWQILLSPREQGFFELGVEMKTKSEAKVLETDVVIFPMKFAQNEQETVLTEGAEINRANEKNLDEADNETRFARLRKSLRKRSASIL
jgi:hypothetical protein